MCNFVTALYTFSVRWTQVDVRVDRRHEGPRAVHSCLWPLYVLGRPSHWPRPVRLDSARLEGDREQTDRVDRSCQ